MKIIECTQGTPEWFSVKRGIPSSSDFDRIITPKKGALSAQADDYICELLSAEYTDAPEPYQSDPMRDGVLTEPEARRWYELVTNEDVRQVGFCVTDNGRFGCSPDGLVGEDGLLELKCPTPKVHVRYLLAGTLPDEYRCQVHGQLLVTGRRWCDFVSYCRNLPPLRVRVTPDLFTVSLGKALEEFWGRFSLARGKLLALTEGGLRNGSVEAEGEAGTAGAE